MCQLHIVRWSPSAGIIQQPVTSSLVSQLDFGNVSLVSLPAQLLLQLQSTLNANGCLTFEAWKNQCLTVWSESTLAGSSSVNDLQDWPVDIQICARHCSRIFNCQLRLVADVPSSKVQTSAVNLHLQTDSVSDKSIDNSKFFVAAKLNKEILRFWNLVWSNTCSYLTVQCTTIQLPYDLLNIPTSWISRIT